MSKDTDFRQLAFLYGPPPKVIWVRVGNGSTSVIENLLRASVAAITRFGDSDEESLLVLSRDSGTAPSGHRLVTENSAQGEIRHYQATPHQAINVL